MENPDLATAIAVTGADIAQNELGYTGAGVKVAVTDTGIDCHQPDLGGGFRPGYRVVTGRDFVMSIGDRPHAGQRRAPAPTSGTYQMARTGMVTSAAAASTVLPAGSLAGKVALIRRGTCGFYNKALNAQNAGAVALLLQAKPYASAQAVRTILQNSADPNPWPGNPGLGYPDQAHRLPQSQLC